MFAPIRFEHKIVGMIYVQSYTPYRYNADDLNVFRSLADHAGSTMMRIQAEEVLNKEKKLYHEVIDQQTEMICRVKPEGTLVFVNEAFARLNGEPRSALIGRNILSYVDSEAIEIFNEALAYLRPENPVFFAEHPLRTYTGKMVWISWTLLALFNEQGEIVELQAVGKDITGRKAAEDALLESKKRFEVLSQATFEAIFISENGICFEQNKTAEMIFGYSKNEAIGRPCTDWIAEQDRERVNQYLLTDYDQPYEVLAQRKDGSTFLAEIRGRTLDYRGVKVRIKALRDISRLKAAEDKIRASLREKEILLSEIHHRVKNNMQAISSLLNLQAEQFEDSTYASLFKESRDRIKSMALIHDRLYHAEDFSGINISTYIATLARYLFRSYGISSDKIALQMHVANVELSLEKAIPCGLIINELLSNAIKYAFPGERRGKIRISMQMKSEKDVELIVSNDGQSLPESFDIHNTKTLGLHLVSLLVLDQLRGTIEVDGKNGASFLIHFSAKS